MPDVFEAVITRLGAQGDGAAEGPGGPVHIPFALPGERVRAVREGKVVRLDTVLDASPDRVDPACAYFGRCGGCQLQHLAPAAVADFKRAGIRAALGHRGFSDAEVLPTLSLPAGERRRAKFAVLRVGRKLFFGFSERRSHRLVDVDACPAVLPGLNRLIAPLRALAHQIAFDAATVTLLPGGTDLVLEGKFRLDLAAREVLADFAAANDIARITAAGEMVLERTAPSLPFAGIPVSPAPGGFLQPSASGEAALVEAVMARLGEGFKRAVDLFAGCGTFTLPLARHLPVIAYEGDAAAVAALDRGWRMGRGLKHVEAVRRDLYRRPVEAVEFDAGDVVVIDPPREGAEAQMRTLAASPVRRIVAVSCSPASFARDARILGDAGFALGPVLPVDQFAWSSHVELVAAFERAEFA
ncbi:class I SAM-dependent RNA methyltransferase [Zavarzinia compransoris]|uniref:class I SAM-dependent RNA methyltransferase n=1 Tax=Zavarzinia marina TaxID=2911065 RepID=UPI001F2B8434|nr:class I SAM-dependent RNA methyltransferase [Zavarzinia marina]MCF4165802.1 class I SAM-dependent RNA methyltransferase [Zavarzinia marina]